MTFLSVKWSRRVGLLLLGLLSATPLRAEETAASEPAESVIRVLPSANLPHFENRRAADDAIERKLLETRLDFSAEEMPLNDALRQISEQLGVTLRFHHQTFDERKIAPDVPVSIQLRSVRAETLLRLLLRKVDLVHVIHRGQLLVIPEETAEKYFVTRYYRREDLLDDGGRQFNPDGHFDVIVNAWYPESWVEMGGAATSSVLEDGLVITHTRAQQRRIERLFTALRTCYQMTDDAYDAKPHAIVADVDEFEGLRKTLREVQLAFEAQEIPLVEVIDHLRAESGLNFWLGRKVALDSKVSGDWNELPLEQVLDEFTEPLGLAWSIDENVIRIDALEDSDAEESMLLVRVYPVRDFRLLSEPAFLGMNRWTRQPNIDLVHPGVTGGSCRGHFWLHLNLNGSIDEVLESIIHNIEPESWEELGGPGIATDFSDADCVVVLQSLNVHEKIEQLLQEVRGKRSGQKIPEWRKPADNDPLVMQNYYVLRPGQIPLVSKEDFEILCKRLTSLVAPASWDDEGVFIDVLSDRALIRHRESVHKEIRQFFNATGSAAPDLGPGPPGTGVISPIPLPDTGSGMF